MRHKTPLQDAAHAGPAQAGSSAGNGGADAGAPAPVAAHRLAAEGLKER